MRLQKRADVRSLTWSVAILPEDQDLNQGPSISGGASFDKKRDYGYFLRELTYFVNKLGKYRYL